jgi:hypothetical protein
MSELTIALDRIMNWLQQYKPDIAETYLEGLSREEIEELTKDLIDKIPEEIYDLYQWRNGTKEEYYESVVYPLPIYLPLDQAIEAYQGLNDDFSDENLFLFEGKRLFPFLRSNCSHCAVLVEPEKQQSSNVIDIADEGDLSLMYQSLTSMMLTLAEYFETGAYYIRKTSKDSGSKPEEGAGFISPDHEKMLPIFQKYNSGLELIR